MTELSKKIKQIEMKDTPFVRFRHGNRICVDPNIKDTIKTFLQTYKEKGKAEAFKLLIRDIGDGSGWGIHPDSTWIRSIWEMFEVYDDYEPFQKTEVEKVIIEILEVLAQDSDIESVWDGLVGKIKNSIEILSCWEYSHIKTLGDLNKIQKDDNGYYYLEKSGRRVNVIGTKTLEENKFEFIEDDITRDHGKIARLLKFIEMTFISFDFPINQKDYREGLFYVMNEADTSTWFLHGMWRVETSHELIPISWYPKNCFTNIKWLKSELVVILAEKCRVDQEAIPKIVSTDDNLSKWQEAFNGYPLQYEIAYETNVILGSEPFGSDPDEIYIEFEGRKLRWINGTKYVYPTLIIPAKNDSYDEEREIAKKFISSLIFSENYPIREFTSAACPKKYSPLLRQPRTTVFLGVSSAIFTLLSQQRSEKQWQALAYYKEAINSESSYYQFLCFYNTIKLAFLNANNQEDNRNTDLWIDSQVQTLTPSPLITQITSNGASLGAYLRHEGGRNAVSHVGILGDGNHPTYTPDNLVDRQKIQEVIPIVKELAEKVIKNGMIN